MMINSKADTVTIDLSDVGKEDDCVHYLPASNSEKAAATREMLNGQDSNDKAVVASSHK